MKIFLIYIEQNLFPEVNPKKIWVAGSLNSKKNKNEDWSQKWKEKWDVTHVTDKIAVVPDWIDYSPKKNEIMIKLEPGCAFGTGTHQTTQLCMKALEKYMKPGYRVADVGMGSGILSILAKKLGASYVYGCDNDETVIDVARENSAKNNVECTFEVGTADKINDKFDFVVANILHFVLAEYYGRFEKYYESWSINVIKRDSFMKNEIWSLRPMNVKGWNLWKKFSKISGLHLS